MNDKSPKNKRAATTNSRVSSDLNALLDCIIIELLKKNPDGLSRNKINDKLQEYSELEKKSYRTRIDTRLEYLTAFGHRSGLFEIRSNHEGESDTEGKKEVFQYFNKMSDAEIQLMLRSYRSIKGNPAEKDAKDKTTGKKRPVRHSGSKEFFENLTTKRFIRSFNNEEPHELINPKMIKNIKEIKSAIDEKKVLAIQYGDYDINKQLCHRKNKEGEVIVYKVYPIRMVVSLGRYYLYCRHKQYVNLSCMRIDRMITCAKTSEDCQWKEEDRDVLLQGIGEPHFAQRLYMFTGRADRITFLTDEKHLNDVFDWFGSDVELKKTDDNRIRVTVKADKNAMLYWAMQYSRYVKVIDPPELVENIKQSLAEALDQYRNT